MYEHVLTIGTTGMLAEATCELARQTRALTCLARTTGSLERLEQQLDKNAEFHAVSVDYHNTDAFMNEVEKAWQRAPFDLVLVWIHSSARASLDELMTFLAEQSTEVKLFNVVGSAAGNPDKKAEAQKIPASDTLQYHQIILGFQVEASRSRWLTHGEISRGTLRAIRQQQASYVIGTVTPWSARP